MIVDTAVRLAVWAIAVLALAGVLVRPFRLPEALWAATGAAALVLLGLMPLGAAGAAVLKGGDVYLFLTGMMLLSESARREGLFDWAAAHAVARARGSTGRLFALVFGVGIVVTIFLSNDATAVVLTPAVYAAARKAKADPLPMLFACALTANAASFVLPISNPANLILYGGALPPLGAWLAAFALPSALAIAATFVLLRWAERTRLAGDCGGTVELAPLSRGGAIAFAGIAATAIVLLAASALGIKLGLPTCIAGAATTALVCFGGRRSPLPILKSVSWSILALVAGLFVLVEALGRTGVTALLARRLAEAAAHAPAAAAGAAGTILAFAANLTNNLPAGLIASDAVARAHAPRLVVDALLIGVDLGPNLSITGSLATILWLAALRREGVNIGFRQFLKIGAITMPPALLIALAGRIALG